jgi:hypothetical protein
VNGTQISENGILLDEAIDARPGQRPTQLGHS